MDIIISIFRLKMAVEYIKIYSQNRTKIKMFLFIFLFIDITLSSSRWNVERAIYVGGQVILDCDDYCDDYASLRERKAKNIYMSLWKYKLLAY